MRDVTAAALVMAYAPSPERTPFFCSVVHDIGAGQQHIDEGEVLVRRLVSARADGAIFAEVKAKYMGVALSPYTARHYADAECERTVVGASLSVRGHANARGAAATDGARAPCTPSAPCLLFSLQARCRRDDSGFRVWQRLHWRRDVWWRNGWVVVTKWKDMVDGARNTRLAVSSHAPRSSSEPVAGAELAGQ